MACGSPQNLIKEKIHGMRAVKVEYTVKPGYVDTNKANIAKVMEELRATGDKNILYSTYLKEDGVSFVHFAIYNNADNILTSLPAFKAFTTQLKAEGLAGNAPKTQHLQMVGKSFDF